MRKQKNRLTATEPRYHFAHTLLQLPSLPRATVTLPCIYPTPYLPYTSPTSLGRVFKSSTAPATKPDGPTLYPPYTSRPAKLPYTSGRPTRIATLYLPCTTTRPRSVCRWSRRPSPADLPYTCAARYGVAYPIGTTHWPGPKTVHPSDQVQPAYPTPIPSPDDSHPEGGPPSHTPKSRRATLHPPATPPTRPRLAGHTLGKSRRRTAYPQQIVTTRLLYCLQDRFAQLSRLQRI